VCVCDGRLNRIVTPRHHDIELELGKRHFPVFTTPAGKTASSRPAITTATRTRTKRRRRSRRPPGRSRRPPKRGPEGGAPAIAAVSRSNTRVCV
jgi:hypothetical protein